MKALLLPRTVDLIESMEKLEFIGGGGNETVYRGERDINAMDFEGEEKLNIDTTNNNDDNTKSRNASSKLVRASTNKITSEEKEILEKCKSAIIMALGM